jgi:Uma2 family endonuclease
MPLKLDRRLVSVSEYHLMGEVGILKETDHVELIRGEIIEMSPIESKHATCVKRVNALFNRILRDQAIVSIQDPVSLDLYSEPEPDIALLRPPLDAYSERHPRPDDIFLVIEVADSSFDYDLEIKVPLYAEAGIRECWLVDLIRQEIQLFREPLNGKYQQEETIVPDGDLHITEFEVSFSAKDVLGN